MRATLEQLLGAALAVLETGRRPVAPLWCPGVDLETIVEACVAGLEGRGCRVEISAYPSWEGEDGANRITFCGICDRDARCVWVYGGLDPDELLLVLLHEVAHFLDRSRRGREFAACLAVSVGSLELKIFDEPVAVQYLVEELPVAARAEFGRSLAVEDVPRRVRPLLGKPLLNRAARVAQDLVTLVREGLQRCEKT